MPDARLIFRRKRVYDDGTVSEIRLWEVPAPVRGSTHRFKYSLFFGRPGERWIGYDNEAGKGDHRHLDGHEEPYSFVSPEILIRDFLAEVARRRRRNAVRSVQ